MQRKLTNIAFLIGILLVSFCAAEASNCSFTVIVSVTDASCNGIFNGSATVDPSGNNANYTYLWDDPNNQTTFTATNLTAGVYQVHIKDLTNCDTVLSVTVGQVSGINGNITKTDASCNGVCDGTALAHASGGTLPYSFQWDDPSLQKDSLAKNLCAGTYIVTVKDAQGCIAKKSVTINEPSELMVSSTDASLICYGSCNANVSATAAGGTLPYSYSWNDPLAQTSANATNLCGGNFIVTVTDGNGCKATDTSVITQPAELIGTITPTHPLCFGDCNGATKVTASGGAGGYTYLWNNGSKATSLSKLCEGTYNVIVTDKNSCKDTAFVTLIAPKVVSATATNSTVDCNSSSGNMAIALVNGGTIPYSYQWSTSPIQINDTATNLSAGTYIVVVKDANGCQATAQTTISNSTPVFIPTPTVVQPTCQANNGQITINAYGGQGALTYSWSNSSLNTNSMTGLSPGTYTITVSDTNNCSTTTSIVLSNSYNAVFLDTVSTKNVSCYGGNDGSSSVLASGGNSPYNYVWNTNPVQTTTTATNLKAGNYLVYVTDKNGCSDTLNLTITQPQSIAIDSVVKTPSCKSNCDGKAFAIVSAGLAPYTYSWNTFPVQTNDTASNLCAGSYMVSVIDANGCSSYLSVVVGEPVALSISFTSTAVSCNGKSDGQSLASVTGGTAPYSYVWNTNPIQTTATAVNLAAGTYNLTVTDANGCNQTSAVTINEPNILAATISSTNLLCYGNCNGTATATVSGGTTPYTYAWNTNPVQTTSSALNLCSGNYTVSIQDANGCAATANVNITEPAQMSLTTSSKDASCGINDGQASVIVNGGASPYLYAWTGNTTQSTATATNLSAGTYYITVYDANGCSASDTVVVNNSNPLSFSTSSTGESCQFNDGTASVIASGGSGNYSYLWNTNPLQTTSSAVGLVAGNYTVVVTDKSSGACKDSVSVMVAAAPVIAISFTPTSPSCSGGTNGSIIATVSGGSSPYSYSWTTSPVQTTQTATNLTAGSYSVTVTDVNGCVNTNSFTLAEPNVLTLSASTQNNSCSGSNNGSAIAVPNGGTAPYSYLWSNGSTASSITNLAIGTYSVTVTDASGCFASTSITITEPIAMSVAVSSTNVKCFGQCDGTASATVSGGTSPYVYSWDNGKTTASISTLCVGIYTITVTDSKGCIVTASVNITEPPLIKLKVDTTVADCGMDNGKAYVTATGGTSPFTFNWSTPIPQTGDSAINIEPGVYAVTATDANGCKQSQAFIISTMTPFYLTITKQNVTRCDSANGKIEVEVDSGGVAPYSFEWDNGDTINMIDKLAKGTYFVTITDSNGCDTTAVIQIIQPPAITLTGTSIDASCGMSDGQATVIASGGTGPLSYAWSDSVNYASTAINLAAGSYSVHVSDTIKCSADTTFIINQPPPVNLLLTGKDISCGLNNGEVYAIVTGGSGNFSLLWSNGFMDTTITNLSPGVYSVNVQDTNGCSAQDSITINGTQSLVVTPIVKDANCGASNGEIYLKVSGGDGIYSYGWQTISSTNDTVKNLSKGFYIVTVNDTSGCSSTDTIEVKDVNPITILLNDFDIDCFGNNNGKIVADVSGGSGNYLFSWSNGMTTADSITNLSVGTYYLTVTDASLANCFEKDTATITEPGLFSMTSTYQNITCYGDQDGKIKVNVTGGTGIYTYNWTNTISTIDSAVNLSGGVYVVSVVDSNACMVSDTFTIVEPDSLILALSIKDIACGGANDGTINTTVSGGTFPYTYTWSTNPVQTTSFALNLGPGTYTVLVQDKNGCTRKDSASITQPDTVKISTYLMFGSCNGTNDHAAYTVATGGSGVYSYAWNTNPVQYTDTAFGLGGGAYVVTVTDSTGCSATDTIDIPSMLTITSTSQQDVTCYGKNNGSIYVYTSGGSGEGTYSFSWNYSSLNNDSAMNLAPGTYIVTVVDTNGCMDADTVQIVEPTQLTITLDSINPSCGTSNGEVSVQASGGSLPYSYLWSNGSTLANVSGIPFGTYWVDVTDANGCLVSDTTSIIEANPIILNMNFTDALCYGANNGTASVSAAGGSGAYYYAWSNGATTSSIKNLSPATYVVTVTDITSSLCNATDSITISEPALLTVSGTANNTCMGMNDGSATMIASGGIQPYTYQWSNGGTTATITNLVASNYVGVVTDSNNCQASVTVSVKQPTTIFYLPAVINSAYCGSANGSIYLDVYSTAPLTFEWSNDSTNNTDYAVNLDSGTYYVHLFDTAGCDVYDTIVLMNMDYYPVVTISDSSNLSCIGYNDGMAVAVASGTNGSYSFEWNSSPIQTTDTAVGLAMGMYMVTVTDSLGCKGYDSIFIQNPDTLQILFNVQNITCYGFNDGSVLANVMGGFSPYTYLWSTGDTLAMIDSLVPGNYKLTVLDSNQCLVVDSIDVIEPFVLADTGIVSHLSCFASNDGKIELLVSGGTFPYTYDWPLTGDTSSIDSLLVPGTYSVNVTDSNGCFITDTFTITEPTLLVVDIDSFPSTCSYANGQISVVANGGVGGYSYLWSNGDTNSLAQNVGSGIYSVMVTDSNGCIAIDSVSVVDIPALSIDSIYVINNTCHLSNDASIEIVSVSGAGPFAYSWDPIAASDPLVTNLASGLYTVVVTDTNNCADTMQISITEPDDIILLTQDTVTICYGMQDTLSVTAMGGNGVFSYVWDQGLDSTSSHIVNPVVNTLYNVIALDSSGCSSDTVAIYVLVNDSLQLQIVADSSVCEGEPTVLYAFASGGNGGPYNFSWNSGLYSGDSISITPASSTNFIVTVTDNCGSQSAQDSIVIQVNPIPVTSMFFSNAEGCSPVIVDFSYSTDIGDSLVWDFGDGTFSTDTAPQHSFINSGIYNVTLTTISSNGCKGSSTNSAQVTVFSSPSAQFEALPNTAEITNPVINFNDLSLDAYSWYWNFNDPGSSPDTVSMDANPVHVFSDTGIFHVQLIVMNVHGCLDTVVIPVDIKDTYIMTIPNAFSPNGDGLNDVFIPVGYGTDPEGYIFSVFDRWGDQVFSSSDIHSGWDGTVNGGNKKAMIDVYVWKLHIKDLHGFYHDYIGNVALIE